MPITLNHSNISVQYSSDKSYIIETVKSDLYRRNEIIDTIVRDNIQVAPVTPSIYIENGNNGSNIYAVETYPYTGSANTADYTRVFPKSTTCDILVVGGGGGGAAGGGGAGGYVYNTGISLNGTYAIKTGKGGTGTTGGTNGNQGANSSIIGGAISYTAYGGGGGGGNNVIAPAHTTGQVGSYGGNGHDITTVQTYTSTQGNRGGKALAGANCSGGGGGGAGAIGGDSVLVSGLSSQPTPADFYRGGQGGTGLPNDITGSVVYYAGGGTAGTNTNNSTDTTTQIAVLGGGGIGSRANTQVGSNGTNGLGGGGGGGDWERATGTTGGSGIVIIRYLLGTIPFPTNNRLTSEPTVSPYIFITSDIYYPRIPATNSATWNDNGYIVNAKISDNAKDPSDGYVWYVYNLFNNSITNPDTYHSGSPSYYGPNNTYIGSTRFKTFAGIAISIDFGRSIYPKRMRIAPRPLGFGATGNTYINGAPKEFKIFASDNFYCWNDNDHSSWVEIHNQTSSLTYTDIKYTIVNFTANLPKYRYYTMVVLSTIGSYSGGYLQFSEWDIGGDEKIDSIQDSITHKTLNFAYNNDNLVAWYRFNGNYLDSSGNGHNLTNVGTVIQSTQVIEGQAVEFDSTDYLEFPATINPYTIWNGKGITFSFWVRFTAHSTWARLIDFWQTVNSGSVGLFMSVKANDGLNIALYLHVGSTVFKYSDWNNSLITNLNVWRHIVWSIDISGILNVYLDNVRINGTETVNIPNITYNLRYINKSAFTADGVWGGQMDDFRIYDRALSSTDVASLYNKTYSFPPNTYTVNFPVPTITDINNNSNIILRGAYDIALSTSNSVIIPKEGQYIPKPTTFINYSIERMYPPVRNFTSDTTIVSGQTYGNGTYIFSASSFYNLDIQENPHKVCNNVNIGWTTLTQYGASGQYSGSFSLGGYSGEWIKIQLPVKINLTKYILQHAQFETSRSPSIYKIFGSNDNISWVELVNKSIPLTTANYVSNLFEENVITIGNYNYFAIVVNKIIGQNYLSIGEWYIYGQELLQNSLSIRYNLLNPTLDPTGAQWTYSSNNTNVYHMGSVGIGTTSPEYQLDVRGAIYSSIGGYTQTGLTSWSITSDRRIKENITRASYDICLENVKNIELYNFNFKNNCVNTNDKHQLGFIAQEVQQVYPKAVEVGKIILNTNEAISDILTLNTTQIDYTLYGAVKNLIEKIEDIDNDLESIEKLI
jgi:hypothetical protein